jgi:hypothetical protein
VLGWCMQQRATKCRPTNNVPHVLLCLVATHLCIAVLPRASAQHKYAGADFALHALLLLFAAQTCCDCSRGGLCSPSLSCIAEKDSQLGLLCILGAPDVRIVRAC